ncbi:MAG: Gfo/Idh/MocA family oxidoreductase [Candidatus Hydrogenedentes bacterium]|nr:Gfo/Idh/MocA family oxidoreductase [Candidatus Hydrogenedentota bacterium]
MASRNGSLGVGILGAGFMGQTYARTVATMIPRARLMGIAGGSRAPRLAQEYGVRVFASPEEMIACDEIDLVCIATPHASHGEQGLAVARAGKHLMIEKPMACTVEVCDAILDACKQRGTHCSVMFSQRLRTCPLETKKLLDSDKLGRILHMHSFQLVPDGMEGAVPKWQLDPANVGILLGHGIHNIDQARYFTGREIRSVYAKVSSLDGRYPVDGTSDVTLTMEDGTVCTIFCSFELVKPGFARTGGATQIVCELGLVDVDWYGEMRVSFDGGPWEVAAAQEPIDWAGKGFLDPVRLKSYAANIQNLVDAIDDGKPLAASGWDGRQAVAAALAAYESSRTGREVAPA